MMTRGIRGATTIESDTQENVLSATRELLNAIVASNPGLKTDAIGIGLLHGYRRYRLSVPCTGRTSNGLGSGSDDVCYVKFP